jgi:hypothetical protein
MRKRVLSLLGVAFVMGSIAFSAAVAAADNKIWTGQVVHVSTTNIKVWNGEGCGQTISFLVVPRFNHILSDEGNTTYQMTDIKPGMWVTVYYDQNALGARHADQIVVLHNGTTLNG